MDMVVVMMLVLDMVIKIVLMMIMLIVMMARHDSDHGGRQADGFDNTNYQSRAYGFLIIVITRVGLSRAIAFLRE